MRVLYSFPHALGRPGIGTTAFHQVQGLLDEGVDVVLYCTSLHRAPEGALRVTETLRRAGVRVPHRALGVYRSYAYHDRCVARALPSLADEIDVVHCWPAACLQTCYVARALGITTLREAPSAHTASAYEAAARAAQSVGVALPRNHSHRFDQKHLRREEAEFASAEVLLVPSPYVEQSFLDRGFPPERLATHQYGFDPAEFYPDDRHDRSTQGPLKAVFIGRGEPNKGLHYALESWHQSGLAEAGRLLVCGNILPEYRERLKTLLEHPSIQERGFVEDIASVLREADVMLLPSLTEGSALVVFEALACGCVPLVSDAAGARFTDLEGGVVHPAGDAATLAEHLRMLDGDRSLLQWLRTRAIAGSAEWTWQRAAERLVEIYRDACKTRSHPHNSLRTAANALAGF